jgi:hypothetical protein
MQNHAPAASGALHECEVTPVAGPSSQDIIDLTKLSSGSKSQWVIDLTTDDPCSSSKSKGKSKAQPMDVIDLT